MVKGISAFDWVQAVCGYAGFGRVRDRSPGFQHLSDSVITTGGGTNTGAGFGKLKNLAFLCQFHSAALSTTASNCRARLTAMNQEK